MVFRVIETFVDFTEAFPRSSVVVSVLPLTFFETRVDAVSVPVICDPLLAGLRTKEYSMLAPANTERGADTVMATLDFVTDTSFGDGTSESGGLVVVVTVGGVVVVTVGGEVGGLVVVGTLGGIVVVVGVAGRRIDALFADGWASPIWFEATTVNW